MQVVKDSFYALKDDIFYDVAERWGKAFAEGDEAALRALAAKARVSLVTPLREGRLDDLDEARVRLGELFVENVVLPVRQGFLSKAVEDFFRLHREIARSNLKELRGFLQFLIDALCYTGKV